MPQTVSDVLTRAKRHLALLAKRADDPLVTPDPSDDAVLKGYLGDAVREVGTRTDHLATTTTPETTPGQPHVSRPPHIETIQDAYVHGASKSYAMKLYDGAEVSRAAQAPDADEGRPKFIGAHGNKLWLYPVPGAEYELSLQATMNGEHGSSAPADDTDPPTLNDLVDQLPPALDRALVAYVTGQWLEDRGEPELAGVEQQRFARDLRRHRIPSSRQRTHERSYNPLGI